MWEMSPEWEPICMSPIVVRYWLLLRWGLLLLSNVPELQFNAILAPMLIAAFGVILSLLGIFMVKTKEGASQLQLLRALDRGINTSSVLIVAASFLVIHLLGPELLDLRLGDYRVADRYCNRKGDRILHFTCL